MGEVLEAVRTGPGGFRMPVALKRLSADESIRGEAVQRFFAEARILARLDHPNVVRVLDVLSVDAGYFIVMELLRGATLAELCREQRDRGEPMPWQDVLAIADQALAGLAAAHAAVDDAGRPLGLVHRDVTPRNLLITEGGVVKVLDFGLAKLHERLELPITREGTIQGTLEFLAPEQALGEACDAATDVYQMGACLYWALSGRFPHGPGTTAEMVARVVHKEPVPVTSLREDLPEGVAALVAKAMAREKSRRFASAEEMREAVVALVGPTGVGKAELAKRVGPRALPPEEPVSELRELEGAETVNLGPTPQRKEAPPPAPSIRRGNWIIVGTIAAAVIAISLLGIRQMARKPATPVAAEPAVIREVLLTLLASDEQPVGGSLSPDGKRLAYATLKRLMVKPVGRGEAKEIELPAGFSCNDVEFFPDEKSFLVFGQHESGDWQLWRIGDRPELLHQERRFFNARLSPDGTRVAMGGRTDVQVLTLEPRAFQKIVTLAPGEIVSAVAWSPDGSKFVFVRDDSIELADPSTGATRVLHRRSFDTFMVVSLGWPGEGRLLYVVNGRDGATLHELRFDASTATESAIHNWSGQHVQNGRWTAGRFLYVRGTTRYGIYVGEAGPKPRWERVTTGDGQARRLAGWTDDGELVYAGDGSGTPDVKVQDPAGAATIWVGGAEVEMPDTLAGDAVIFQRPEGEHIGVWRASRRGKPDRITRVAATDAAANVVRCAGDRKSPCVLADLAKPGVARYALLWPSSEEKGRVIGEVPVSNRFLRSHALSPDGKILAVVHGGESVITFDTLTGERTDVPVGGGIELQSVSWTHAGDAMLVTGIGWRGHNFQALRVTRAGAIEPIASHESLWTWRLQESDDGRIAATGLEYMMDLAMLEGL